MLHGMGERQKQPSAAPPLRARQQENPPDSSHCFKVEELVLQCRSITLVWQNTALLSGTELLHLWAFIWKLCRLPSHGCSKQVNLPSAGVLCAICPL
jgi:hypothetical protein